MSLESETRGLGPQLRARWEGRAGEARELSGQAQAPGWPPEALLPPQPKGDPPSTEDAARRGIWPWTPCCPQASRGRSSGHRSMGTKHGSLSSSHPSNALAAGWDGTGPGAGAGGGRFMGLCWKKATFPLPLATPLHITQPTKYELHTQCAGQVPAVHTRLKILEIHTGTVTSGRPTRPPRGARRARLPPLIPAAWEPGMTGVSWGPVALPNRGCRGHLVQRPWTHGPRGCAPYTHTTLTPGQRPSVLSPHPCTAVLNWPHREDPPSLIQKRGR